MFRGTTLGWPLPSLGSVDFHGPLVTDLVLRRLLVPVSALLFRQRLEVPRDDLRDLAELGLGIGGLDVVPRGVGVQEEAALVALGGVGVLLLLGPLFLLGGVGVGVGIVGPSLSISSSGPEKDGRRSLCCSSSPISSSTRLPPPPRDVCLPVARER